MLFWHEAANHELYVREFVNLKLLIHMNGYCSYCSAEVYQGSYQIPYTIAVVCFRKKIRYRYLIVSYIRLFSDKFIQKCEHHWLKKSVFGVFLVHIFQHSYWIRRLLLNLLLRIQSECWKIGIRKSPNTDTFHSLLQRENLFT